MLSNTFQARKLLIEINKEHAFGSDIKASNSLVRLAGRETKIIYRFSKFDNLAYVQVLNRFLTLYQQ